VNTVGAKAGGSYQQYLPSSKKINASKKKVKRFDFKEKPAAI